MKLTYEKILKSLLITFLILSPIKSFSNEAPSPIVGQWRYYGYFYKDNFFPPNDPNLELSFSFLDNGNYRLYWTRTSDKTEFCEALGVYNIIEDKIQTEILWVNPDNHFNCASDPDMNVGRRATTSYIYLEEKNELRLLLPVSDYFLEYALKRVNKQP